MTEPQVWTLIGVFSATLFALFATTSGYFVRTMKAGFDRVDAQFDRVDAKIDGLKSEMNAKFDRVDTQFELVDVKFARLEDRLNHIDRDVQAISRRVFPDV